MVEDFGQGSPGMWEWLRGSRPLQRATLFLLFLFLLGGIGGQAYYLYRLYDRGGANSLPPRDRPVNVREEESRIQKEEREFRQIMLYRKHSREYAGVILAISREPYRADLPQKTTGTLAANVPQEVGIPEILPPYMTVRAVFIVGNRKTALMDIENEGSGIIVEEGNSFGGGLGKILAISQKGVVLRWSKSKITIPLLE